MIKAIRALDPLDVMLGLLLFLRTKRVTAPQVGRALLDSGAVPQARMAYKDMDRRFGYAIVFKLEEARLVEHRGAGRFEITAGGRAVAARFLADYPDLRAALINEAAG